jgi:RND family efflux transporter MFP subunit
MVNEMRFDMKAYALFLSGAMIGVLLFSCSPKSDKQATLRDLEDQRTKYEQKITEIDEQISALKEAIVAEGGVLQGLPEKTAVKVDSIRRMHFRHYIEIQGNVESDNNIFIPAESPGIVKRIYVDEGDRVSRGQVLAELDAELIMKSLEEVQLNLELATTVFERQQRLWDQKIGSEMQYLQAKNAKEILEKRLSTIREQLQKTKITAPISGVVDLVAIKEGEAAAAGFGAIRVVQNNNLKVKAQVSEKYIMNIRRGDSVDVEITGVNLNFRSRITAVSSVIDPDARTFAVEVDIPNEFTNLANNMLAVLKLNDYVNEKAITVPINVVQTTGEEEFLFMAIPDAGAWRAEKRMIKTGMKSGNRVEILSDNITPGDMVIIAGFQNIASGQSLSVVE